MITSSEAEDNSSTRELAVFEARIRDKVNLDSPLWLGVENMRISLLMLVGIIAVCAGPVLAETKSTYVGPSDYLNYDCPQLLREARAVSARSASLAGVRHRDVGADGSRTNSAVIPWPEAFSTLTLLNREPEESER